MNINTYAKCDVQQQNREIEQLIKDNPSIINRIPECSKAINAKEYGYLAKEIIMLLQAKQIATRTDLIAQPLAWERAVKEIRKKSDLKLEFIKKGKSILAVKIKTPSGN